MADDRWPPFLPKVLDDYPLDPFEFRVLCRVARRAGERGGWCHESNHRTATECGMSESKVRYAKALLVKAGMLEQRPRAGRTNEYRLAPPDRWADSAVVGALRVEVRRRRQKAPADPPAAAPQTAAPGTAVQSAGHRGTTDRTPRHQEPDTAAPSADEGSPRKVLPERSSQEGTPDPARARLLREYLDALDQTPPRKVVAQLTTKLDELLEDGVTHDDLSGALSLLREREDAGPGLLPWLVDEWRKKAAAGREKVSAFTGESGEVAL